ncbi:hypothetical protein [Nocardioides sp. InS609-2]|uniref:hypothetical protein n=1 Tax=Nocardioides sp. InS609-2 TaxID=2760705 RepID=UPI0020BDDA19|nr:hypothetical protein [Nocardioides sp. InS609-2]
MLATALPHGCWVAVTVRRPSKKERTRNHTWLAHRLSTAVPTHHSMSPDALVVSIYAGGVDPHATRALLDATRSAMPGFDISATAEVPTRSAAVRGPVLSTLVGTGLAVATGLKADLVPAFVDAPGHGLVLPGAALAAVSVLAAAGRFTGLIASAWSRARRAAADLDFGAPTHRRGKPKPPRKETVVGDKPMPAFDGDYPLDDSAFLVGPQTVVGVIAPQAGAASGETSTKHREVPPVLLARVGPLIGDTAAGPAYLPATDAFGGIGIVGKAGSGKSALTRSLWGWACLERQHPSGLPGFPGARNALIAFESKGDGVADYQRWVDATGDVMVVIDVADPASVGIDLFAVPGTVTDRAAFFVNACIYAFGEQAIGNRSFETLMGVLPAALLVTREMAAEVENINPDGSPLYFAHVLLGGRSEDAGRMLAAEIAGASVLDDADPQLTETVVGLSPLYGANVSPAQRRALQEAPRNKIRQLMELEQWWAPARRKVTWDQILTNHRAVVVNTGTSRTGRIVEDELSRQMSAILMFSLRHAIQRNCSGWETQGRSVSIYADELALLAGSSEAVIAWLKDQGRSFGVRPTLATQRPEQLPDKVRTALMNFSTLVSYTQEDMKTARELAEGVSGDEGDWQASDILQLSTYTAVVRSHVVKKRQPAFTVHVRDFEADRAGFAEVQGYPATGSLARSITPTEPAVSPVMADPTPMAVVVDEEPEDDRPADFPNLLTW